MNKIYTLVGSILLISIVVFFLRPNMPDNIPPSADDQSINFKDVDVAAVDQSNIPEEEAPKPIISPVRKSYTPSEDQMDELNKFEQLDIAGWTIRWNEQADAVQTLGGKKTKGMAGNPEDVAFRFLEANRSLFRLDPQALRVRETSTIADKHHITFQQFYQGLPVEAAMVTVHMTSENEIYKVKSSFVPSLALERTTAYLSAGEAVTKALQEVGVKNGDEGDIQKELVVFIEPDARGFLIPENSKTHLAWKVRFSASDPLGAWVSFIDALTGEMIFKYNDLQF